MPGRRPSPVAERFSSLIRSITFQLLATSAAVHDPRPSRRRLRRRGEHRVGPEQPALRACARRDSRAPRPPRCWISAAHARDGRVNLAAHGRMSDEAIIAEVTAVHGVGPWTTQMYLMHTLGRRDVWPVGDFGVRHGWSLVHGLDEMITEKELRATAARPSSVCAPTWRGIAGRRSICTVRASNLAACLSPSKISNATPCQRSPPTPPSNACLQRSTTSGATTATSTRRDRTIGPVGARANLRAISMSRCPPRGPDSSAARHRGSHQR